MENNVYNSLTEKLIQNGILGNEKPEQKMPLAPSEEKNIFKETSSVEIPDYMLPPKKRLNQFDLELLNKTASSKKRKKQFLPNFEAINRFINFKGNLLNRFCFAFLPKVYKAKLIKEAMADFSKMDIDISELSDKSIPYGESEIRYQNLIKYIQYANDIQVSIKKKI